MWTDQPGVLFFTALPPPPPLYFLLRTAFHACSTIIRGSGGGEAPPIQPQPNHEWTIRGRSRELSNVRSVTLKGQSNHGYHSVTLNIQACSELGQGLARTCGRSVSPSSARFYFFSLPSSRKRVSPVDKQSSAGDLARLCAGSEFIFRAQKT